MKNEELILLVDDDPGNLKHAQTSGRTAFFRGTETVTEQWTGLEK